MAFRGRWKECGRAARIVGWFLAGYAVALMVVASAVPRHFRAPGERRCYDDWCVAAVSASVTANPAETGCVAGPGSRVWVAVAEVSSDAKRVRQRAREDARVEMEDREGRRYEACAGPLQQAGEGRRALSDELGPGERFRVFLPFLMPEGAEPAGLVARHGEFPGMVIIGDDQSVLHAPALLRLAVEHAR